MRKLAALAVVGLLVPALAGCADEAPASTGEPLRGGSTGAPPVDPTGETEVEPPRPKGTSERWHFHDRWQGHPTITLLEANVTLEPTLSEEGVPMVARVLALPRGTVVPPETGFLTFTLNWTTPEPGPVNLTYRAADSNAFAPLGDLQKGVAAQLPTTESMCDVPHRQESHWRFNLSAPAPVAADNATGGARAAPRELHVLVQATIGRPLFIDPPHLDWWQGGDVLPLVSGANATFASVATPAERNVTLVGAPPETSRDAVRDNVTVRVDPGRIVPEGTRSLVVLLNWTSEVPGARLTVRYQEANYPSAGTLELAQDGEGARVFLLPVTNGMTDTTYSNRTTWEFHVLPEGTSGFQGEFTMHAWATRHAPADAVRYTLGG